MVGFYVFVTIVILAAVGVCFAMFAIEDRKEALRNLDEVKRYNELPPLPSDWQCVHCGGAQRFTFCKSLDWANCAVFRGSGALSNVVAPHLHGKCERCGAAGAVSRSLDWKRLEMDGKGAVSIAEPADHAGALTRPSFSGKHPGPCSYETCETCASLVAEEATEQINRDLDLLGKR